MKKECDPKGFPRESDLPKQMQGGLRELKVVTAGDSYLKTDKSEKLCLNTLQSYKEMGEQTKSSPRKKCLKWKNNSTATRTNCAGSSVSA